MARSEGGRSSGGRGGGSGGSRDRGGLRALAGCPVGVECLPGLKSTTANLRSGQFNVFARLEVPRDSRLLREGPARTLPSAPPASAGVTILTVSHVVAYAVAFPNKI